MKHLFLLSSQKAAGALELYVEARTPTVQRNATLGMHCWLPLIFAGLLSTKWPLQWVKNAGVTCALSFQDSIFPQDCFELVKVRVNGTHYVDERWGNRRNTRSSSIYFFEDEKWFCNPSSRAAVDQANGVTWTGLPTSLWLMGGFWWGSRLYRWCFLVQWRAVEVETRRFIVSA